MQIGEMQSHCSRRFFRCRADKRCADEAWCSAVLSVEAENIDTLPATF